jgi:hypothetical protein
MLNGKPYAVSTFFRLKEIKFLPDFSEPSHERWLPARMEAEIEIVPFGIQRPSPNALPTIRATINVPEHIRRVLEEALDLELRDFVRFQNREQGPRKVVRVIPKDQTGHGGFSRTLPEETALEVANVLREIYFEKFEVKIEEDPETTRKGDEDASRSDD